VRGRAVLAAFIVLLSVAGFLLVGAGSPIIEAIEVKGGGRIGTSDIQRQSGLRLGEPWSTSSSENAHAAILNLSQVEAISIQAKRVSLQSVVIEIEVAEREPYGVLAVEGRGLYWSDRQGMLIEPVEGPTYLPIFSGISFDEEIKQIESRSALVLYQEFYSLSGDLLSLYSEVVFHGYFLELIAWDGWRLRVPVTGLRNSLEIAEITLRSLEEAETGSWRVIDLRFGGEVTLER
jgi:hypothetical protein